MPTLHGDRPRFKAGLHEIAPGVHAWMQPNGSWGESNSALVTGDGESLLIDTLWTPTLTRKMLDAMAAVTEDAPITRLVNTHADGDHTWGNRLLRDVQIVATSTAKEEMSHVTPGSLGAFRRLGQAMGLIGGVPLPFLGRGTLRAAGAYFTQMLAPFDFSDVEIVPPGRTFSGTLDLDAGGRVVTLIEVGPAHTGGDLIVHVPDANAVIAADVVFNGVVPVMWAGPAERWIAALERIDALAPDVVLPGHGPVCGLEEVRVLRDYWAWLDAAARRRHSDGVSAADATRDILGSDEHARKPWSGWDNPERTVINVATIYRHLDGKGAEPLGVPDRIRLFAQAAALAR